LSEDSVITPEMRAEIGKETVFTSPAAVSRGDILRYVRAMTDPNPLFQDEEFARTTRYGGIIAPPNMVCDLTYNIAAQVAEDGFFFEGIAMPEAFGVPLRGEHEYEFFEPLRPGDVVTSRRRTADIFEKWGSTGRLLFVISEISYTNQRGELLGINRETLIYQLGKEERK